MGVLNFNPFFTIFCKSLLNMPKNIILKNQKNSFTRKISKSEKLRKWPKKGQKWPFLGPGGPNFDPFFTNFCKSLLNMPKKIIYKKKIPSLNKFLSPKNCKNGQKRAKNGRFLALQGRNLRKSKKGLDILLLLPQRGCILNFRKFGSSDLEKMRCERTDGRTDGRD